MVDAKTLGIEWSKAYVLASSRLDKESMLYLMGLVAWPPLTSMYGDLVDDLTLICTLLSKKPMVGYLVARRLRLPEDKTHALLSVLESKGYIKAVGSHLAHIPQVFATDDEHTKRLASLSMLGKTPSSVAVPTMALVAHTNADAQPQAADTATVLKQLWRVLNTDISLNRQDIEGEAKDAETSDVLSQLWRVLNTDIEIKRTSNESDAAADVALKAKSEAETADVLRKLWSVLNTEIAFKRKSSTSADSKADVTGEAAAVMSQLWRVLNTEIAFKRKVQPASVVTPDKDTGYEAADRLSQLWRVLNTEIALKKASKPVDTLAPEADTSDEAADRLGQLWRILNAEIVVTLPPERKKETAATK